MICLINTCTNNGIQADSSWAEKAEVGLFIIKLWLDLGFDNCLKDEPQVGTPIRQSLLASVENINKTKEKST